LHSGGHDGANARISTFLSAPHHRLKEIVMRKKLVAVCATLAFSGLAAPPIGAQSGMHMMVTPSELKWVDVPSLPAGAKLAIIEGPVNEVVPFIFRLKLPANYQIPAHWHPAIEHVTVISGTFNMGVGDKLDKSKTNALVAGSVAVMPLKTTHFAWTQDETIVQVHGMGPWGINYINPEDDPRKK
jgi:hypothetical protein